MTQKILLALGLSCAFALSAAAQTPATPSSTPSQTQDQSKDSGTAKNTADIQQHLSQDLQKAGFTNVEVMPESFLVRAKDKDGRQVMMVINPDSVESVTAIKASASPGSQTTASNSSGDTTKKQ